MYQTPRKNVLKRHHEDFNSGIPYMSPSVISLSFDAAGLPTVSSPGLKATEMNFVETVMDNLIKKGEMQTFQKDGKLLYRSKRKAVSPKKDSVSKGVFALNP